MVALSDNSDVFLRQALDELEFRRGDGYYLISDLSEIPDLAQESWLEQARELNAKAIYFVDDYPTVLFFKLDIDLDADVDATDEAIRQLHLAVWNTSRVPIFFVALPFELRVYNAYQKPARNLQEWRSTNRWLGRVQEITEIAEKLREFSRPEVESGNLFYSKSGTFDRENRVDQWLLKNLRSLRNELQGSDDKKHEYVHALIGRSIFIRYLEDRNVLVDDYFREIIPDRQYSKYTDFLVSKRDTYDLFRYLREEFNGDLFPISDEEENVFSDRDINRLRDFLLGRSINDQLDLLFWAYKFDIIPIELISSIYEEFYYENGGGDDSGTHYTPTPLVDFVLSQCLTDERLGKNPRVLDPACGSGIFLVEAFRRMVFFESRRQKVRPTQLPRETLEEILTQRIVGIDINKAAIQVAAFSLYLAFLDFRNPPDIRRQKQLPRLVFDSNQILSGRTLFCDNAFNLTPSEKSNIQHRVNQKPRYPGRSDDVRLVQSPVLPLERESFDLVVGNPPWGADDSDQGGLPSEWCRVFEYPIGYKELSQCFIWRAHSLLKPEGEVGLLVSNGIFFKHEDKSVKFRQRWLEVNVVRAVYNFSHVRHVFFRKQKKDAISPFAAIFYAVGDLENHIGNNVSYASIKRNALVANLQAVVINKADFRKVRQTELLANEWLWKAHMWGGPSDVELIGELKSCYNSLAQVVDDFGSGYEVKRQSQIRSTDDLGISVELPSSGFKVQSDLGALLRPIKSKKVARTGNLNIYRGERLLIKRGVSRSGKKNGEIHALLANIPFTFTNFIYGFRVDSLQEDHRKILLGILLSSLAKYYHFLTCSTWGFWHDEIHLTEYLQLPVRMTDDSHLIHRITSVVDKASQLDIRNSNWLELQVELDSAIFDLYELSEDQRDLVDDLCQVTLEYFYDGEDAQAVKPPKIEVLEQYCEAFRTVWNPRLASKGKELDTRIFAPNRGLLCAVSFELVDLGASVEHGPIVSDSEWRDWFRRLSDSLLQEYSERVYIDKVVKDITASSLFVIKRSELRLWTKSQARQDARELLTQVFRMEWQRSMGKP